MRGLSRIWEIHVSKNICGQLKVPILILLRLRYTPLPRTQLFDEILASIYRSECVNPIFAFIYSTEFMSVLSRYSSFDTIRCYHSLSLIFIIFAIASLFDPSLPSCSVQAQEYFYLSKAALSFNSPFSHTTFKSIWCMVCMCPYFLCSPLFITFRAGCSFI